MNNSTELQAHRVMQNAGADDLPPALVIEPLTSADIGKPGQLKLSDRLEWFGSRVGLPALVAGPLLLAFPHIGCAVFGIGALMAGGSAIAAQWVTGAATLGFNLAAVPMAIYGLRRSDLDCCAEGEKIGVLFKKVAAMTVVVGALAMDYNALAGRGFNAPEMAPDKIEAIRDQSGEQAMYAYITNQCGPLFSQIPILSWFVKPAVSKPGMRPS